MIRSLLFTVNDRAENLLCQDAGHTWCDQVSTCHWSSMQLLTLVYHNACGIPCHDKSYHEMELWNPWGRGEQATGRALHGLCRQTRLSICQRVSLCWSEDRAKPTLVCTAMGWSIGLVNYFDAVSSYTLSPSVFLCHIAGLRVWAS